MAISVDWGTKVIFVPKSYTSLIQASPFEIRGMDVNQFRLDLRGLEGGEDGMPFPDTHEHQTERILSGISYARFVEIINGYTVEFEDGLYAVSLSGANNNIVDVKVGNQVSVIANNSGGLIGSEAINDQSYLEGRVWIDIVNGTSGSVFDFGTPANRVNNFDDAQFILENRNLIGYHLETAVAPLIIQPTQAMAGTSWRGESADTSRLSLNASVDTTKCTFESMVLFGTANGRITTKYCALVNLMNIDGSFRNTGFNGTITVDSGATLPQTLIECYSAEPGNVKPVFDCNSANVDFQFRGYIGGLEIRNFNQGTNMTIDCVSGRVLLDSSCTAGTIVVAGVVLLTDNSGPGCTVITTSTVTELSAAGTSPWTVAEKDEVIQYSRKASDNAEQANLKL